jgi:hypothetical protein
MIPRVARLALGETTGNRTGPTGHNRAGVGTILGTVSWRDLLRCYRRRGFERLVAIRHMVHEPAVAVV